MIWRSCRVSRTVCFLVFSDSNSFSGAMAERRAWLTLERSRIYLYITKVHQNMHSHMYICMHKSLSTHFRAGRTTNCVAWDGSQSEESTRQSGTTAGTSIPPIERTVSSRFLLGPSAKLLFEGTKAKNALLMDKDNLCITQPTMLFRSGTRE